MGWESDICLNPSIVSDLLLDATGHVMKPATYRQGVVFVLYPMANGVLEGRVVRQCVQHDGDLFCIRCRTAASDQLQGLLLDLAEKTFGHVDATDWPGTLTHRTLALMVRGTGRMLIQ